MNTAQTLNIDLAGEYLLMAPAGHIKSRMLLPREQGADAPTGSRADPREELSSAARVPKYKDAPLRLSALPQLGRTSSCAAPKRNCLSRRRSRLFQVSGDLGSTAESS